MGVAKGRDMDLQQLRAQEFPVTGEWRVFNHAATSPLSVRAATAMEQHIRAQLTHGSLRISPHFYNTTDEIDALLEALP